MSWGAGQGEGLWGQVGEAGWGQVREVGQRRQAGGRSGEAGWRQSGEAGWGRVRGGALGAGQEAGQGGGLGAGQGGGPGAGVVCGPGLQVAGWQWGPRPDATGLLPRARHWWKLLLKCAPLIALTSPPPASHAPGVLQGPRPAAVQQPEPDGDRALLHSPW